MFANTECLSYLNMGYNSEENRTVVFIPRTSAQLPSWETVFKWPSALASPPSWTSEHTPHCCCCGCFSITMSCPALCDPVDCSTPGFPVLHHLLEFAQTCIHWIDDAIQPSHPSSPPSPPAFSFSQHQGLYTLYSSLSNLSSSIFSPTSKPSSCHSPMWLTLARVSSCAGESKFMSLGCFCLCGP